MQQETWPDPQVDSRVRLRLQGMVSVLCIKRENAVFLKCGPPSIVYRPVRNQIVHIRQSAYRHKNGIPFYVLGPTSTIDLQGPTGANIQIEERFQAEIREKHYAQPMALPEAKCCNPSFDVTDHELITAIITEKGICLPPFDRNLRKLLEN